MIMKTLSERLKHAREAKSYSQAALAKKAGVSQPTIGMLETGERNGSKYITQIAQVLDVDPIWLATGKGEYIKGVSKIEEWDSRTPLDDDEAEIPFFKDFKVSCGSGAVSEALLSESRKLRISKSTLRKMGVEISAAAAVTADGNSMRPTINDGDTVSIDTSRIKIKDGKIFAIMYGDNFYFKRLYSMPFGGVRIVSDNKDDHEEIILTSEKMEELKFCVIGQVWNISRLEPL